MEEINDTFQSMRNHLAAGYDKIEEKGGITPKHKNVANFAAAVRSIPTAPPVPDVPSSLSDIKLMLNAGKTIPVGTEIPDTINGTSNPWIVCQNGNAYGATKTGVFLCRKWGYPNSEQVAWSSSGGEDYGASTIHQWLQNTYPSQCSSEINSLVTTINIPYTYMNAIQTVNAKYFLMSIKEMCGINESDSTTSPWQYWISKTGSTGTMDANNGRKTYAMADHSFNSSTWTRDRYGWLGVAHFAQDGKQSTGYATKYGYGNFVTYLPACFIAKD